ncbi:MAG: uracil-DNA glycosylase [Brachymonas sp.]|nr:uracil-DNA glycosylase [Brachymonas sp.]
MANRQWLGSLETQHVQTDWLPLVQSFMGGPAGRNLQALLQSRQQSGAVIYPPEPFVALQLTALANVRVVILGQDPYHGAGQAEGLAFSVARGVKIPPSLRNMFKEIQRDLEISPPSHGSLRAWAAQGVLLLNTCLTVEEGQPASHAKRGWETLTDALIEACARKSEPVVFMLWGAHAQAKQGLIALHNADARHLVLTANHPSPLSALRPPEPFIGCGHFGQARRWLNPPDNMFELN